MTQKTTSKQEEKKAVDELQNKVELFRDDDLYDVYVKDWEKVQGSQVKVYYKKPDGDVASEKMD